MVEIVETKLKKVSYGKSFLFFLVYGLIGGLVLGIISFFFLNLVILSLQSKGMPLSGIVILSFVAIPLANAVLSSVTGLIFVFLTNISLKIIRGISLVFETE